MANAGALHGEEADLVVVDVDGVGVPGVVPDPAEGLHGGHRRQLEVRQRVAQLVEDLAGVRVQPHAVLPSRFGRLAHQIRGDRKGGAGDEHDLQHRAGLGVVDARDDPLGVGQDRLLVLADVVRGGPPFDSPSDMLPRETTKRTPTSAAA